MARNERVICGSADLVEGGKGVRFTIDASSGEVNTCPHLGTDLDWQPGEFFEESGLYLVCSTHGALFEPHNGFCISGPCRGASLMPIEARERDGQVLLPDDNLPSPTLEDKSP